MSVRLLPGQSSKVKYKNFLEEPLIPTSPIGGPLKSTNEITGS
jgi:hypothetical protein